ncbi:MAG TPA: hypothetical protein VJN64_15125 [Terriglobales bacterium]|nr:hypothetical protein [Terriglobales bacterium]
MSDSVEKIAREARCSTEFQQIAAPNPDLPEKVKTSLRQSCMEILSAGIGYHQATDAFAKELVFVAAREERGIVKRAASRLRVNYSWAWMVLNRNGKRKAAAK